MKALISDGLSSEVSLSETQGVTARVPDGLSLSASLRFFEPGRPSIDLGVIEAAVAVERLGGHVGLGLPQGLMGSFSLNRPLYMSVILPLADGLH